jgi:hypothetical protein
MDIVQLFASPPPTPTFHNKSHKNQTPIAKRRTKPGLEEKIKIKIPNIPPRPWRKRNGPLMFVCLLPCFIDCEEFVMGAARHSFFLIVFVPYFHLMLLSSYWPIPLYWLMSDSY